MKVLLSPSPQSIASTKHLLRPQMLPCMALHTLQNSKAQLMKAHEQSGRSMWSSYSHSHSHSRSRSPISPASLVISEMWEGSPKLVGYRRLAG